MEENFPLYSINVAYMVSATFAKKHLNPTVCTECSL